MHSLSREPTMSTPAINRRSFYNNVSSEENARILTDPSVTYRLLYFDCASVGATARDILAFGKAIWTNQHPTLLAPFPSLQSVTLLFDKERSRGPFSMAHVILLTKNVFFNAFF
jgi:hypothetical protein